MARSPECFSSGPKNNRVLIYPVMNFKCKNETISQIKEDKLTENDCLVIPDVKNNYDY